MPSKRKHSSKQKKRSKSRSRSRRSKSRHSRRDNSASDSDSPYRRGKKSKKRLKYSKSKSGIRSRSRKSASRHSEAESATDKDKLAKILETLIKGSPAAGISTSLPAASSGLPSTARSSHSAHLTQMIKGKLPSDLIFRSA